MVETLLTSIGMVEEQRSKLLANDLTISLQCREFLPALNNLLNSSSPRSVCVWHLFLRLFYVLNCFQRGLI